MNSEQQFVGSIQDLLIQSEAGLDAGTRDALLQIRQRAVAEVGFKVPAAWYTEFLGLAVAAGVCMLVVSLWLRGPIPEQAVVASLPQADIALLAEPENIEFYSDMAFYQWLDSEG